MIDYIPPVQQVKPGESIMSLVRNNKGMIIVGYQGIGKSSCSSLRDSIIDLESSNFFVDGERSDNWQVVYCRIAVSLAKQGYTVLISSHDCVRNELAKYVNDGSYTIVSICPSYRLKDLWIQKLHNRYIHTKLDKDYKAWQNAESNYSDSIMSIVSNSPWSFIFLETMDYDLSSIIRSLYRMNQARYFDKGISTRHEGC